jgi:hypothetical protein
LTVAFCDSPQRENVFENALWMDDNWRSSDKKNMSVVHMAMSLFAAPRVLKDAQSA